MEINLHTNNLRQMGNNNQLWLTLSLFLAASSLQGMVIKAEPALRAAHAKSVGQDWPQWRGPGGLGVSSEPNLPEVWDVNSPNIKWKVKIPGKGASSPVVCNGRVILTTALESSNLIITKKIVKIASAGLSAILLVVIGLSFIRMLTSWGTKVPQKSQRRAFAYFDRIVTVVASVCFVCGALIATYQPRYFDLDFINLDLFVSMKDGHRFPLISMAEGAPAPVWLTSGAIALFGLAVSVGWCRRQSFWRFFGTVVVLVIAYLFVILTPLDEWKMKIAFYKRMIFALPGLIVISYHILTYWRIRLRQGMERHIGGIGVLVPLVTTISLSALVFVPANFMGSERKLQRAVVCVDSHSGAVLWTQTILSAPQERKHTDNTYAAPTPATDGTCIIVSFGGAVACLDFDGHVLWRKVDSGYFENTRYGASASPLLIRDAVIVIQEREHFSDRPTWIAALDRQTGNVLWQIQPTNIYGCYTTPLVFHDDSSTQLIISSWETMASYDIESGECLWTIETPLKQLVASMARSGELICVAGGTWGPKATIMLNLSSREKYKSADVLWQSDRGAAGCCSPVIYDGELFTLSDTGEMTCYDALSGKILWNKRLRGRFLSSLVAGDGKIYASNTKGVTTVLAADPKFKMLSKNDLQGRCYASLAIANGCIFIRIGDYLYCIQKEHQP